MLFFIFLQNIFSSTNNPDTNKTFFATDFGNNVNKKIEMCDNVAIEPKDTTGQRQMQHNTSNPGNTHLTEAEMCTKIPTKSKDRIDKIEIQHDAQNLEINTILKDQKSKQKRNKRQNTSPDIPLTQGVAKMHQLFSEKDLIAKNNREQHLLAEKIITQPKGIKKFLKFLIFFKSIYSDN
ncbi:hypothetical protein EDEG_02868 [Edhazardia aedis USNM 41457]|uniref:Uncharacterized protein n=1 Tax=Edhazardia aedis (strain USNM 41457) TaxID=1003232 RepID=J9D5C1_EDHAE|nr:hypothetical protein EDEG_02868 [Edhazardia aedis USNM 41457]|eukprot:EJW02729.1 hypothetical protein EDEG_02868 [Edhazardia aedis USNM 41457]